MIPLKRLAAMFVLGAITAGVSFCNVARAGNLDHGVVFYVPATDPTVLANVASRYTLGVIEDDYSLSATGVKGLNPDFRWFVYNSGTDNYVSGPNTVEDAALEALAAAKGWDVEDAYLHFTDDTWYRLQGDTVFVPGWGAGSAATAAEARIPTYYKDLSRRLVNFNGRGRILNKEVMIDLALDRPFPGTNLHADGIFLDNAAYRLWNDNTVISGGHVAEVPGHPKVDSGTFQTWYWQDCLGPFFADLKDTLETSASWSSDGKRKELMLNISNAWIDDYVTMDTADYLCLEFQYSPLRNHGPTAVQTAYDRDAMAAQAGIKSFYLSKVTPSLDGVSGSYSYDEAVMGSVAWWLVTRTPQTALFLMGPSRAYDPSGPDWETQTWKPAMDVLGDSLGTALGAPYVIATGTDPVGYAYSVMARNYERGIALVRNRGDWLQGVGTATAADVPLPAAFRRLAPDGSTGASVNHVSIRNGEGIVLLAGEGGGPGDPPPPTPGTVNPEDSMLLIGTSPVNGAAGVPATAPVRVRFSLALPVAPPAGWMTVAGSASGARSGSLVANRNQLLFVPSTPWLPGETVTVSLAPAIRAVEGAYLDVNRNGTGGEVPADGFTFAFTIAP